MNIRQPTLLHFRVVAYAGRSWQVIGTACTKEEARSIGDRYMLSLNPDEDECPEIMIERTKGAA